MSSRSSGFSRWWAKARLVPVTLAGVLALATAVPAQALASTERPTSAGLELRMRAEPPEGLDAEEPRAYEGPTAITDEPGRSATWNDPSPNEDGGEGEDAGGEGDERPSGAPAPAAGTVTGTVPPPSSVRDVPEHIAVAVGLAPEAPGTRAEKALLDALEANARASTSPTTEVRHLRPGAGTPRRLCRERREDLVVMIGYVADREAPVVLAHDCRLDRALGVRAADAAHAPGLVGTLWREHLELVRAGARERRRVAVGPRARAGIIAGVAIVVVGVAVGALVANALRDEVVVITVRP